MITQQSPGRSLAAHPGHAAAVTGHARLPPVREVPVSATLAANEAVAARRARLLMDRYGVATLPASAFGEPQRLAAAAGHRAALRRHPGTTERHTHRPGRPGQCGGRHARTHDAEVRHGPGVASF